MSSVRTRKQAARRSEAAAAVSPPTTPNGHALGAPNGAARGSVVGKSGDTGENIFLFVPNIIGYFRIVLALASLYYMPLHPRTCSGLYSVSCLLDALDGVAARRFEQATRFGAVLDMVTDRCTTSCLLVFLSSAWPRWSLLFQGLISLDFASHYMHMFATLTMAGQGTSHKSVDSSRSRILHLYYTNKTVLFIFCALNELFFIALYLLSFSSPTLSPALLQPLAAAAAEPLPTAATASGSSAAAAAATTFAKLFPNPWSAGALELARANKMDSFGPWVLAGISFPVMAAKQVVNVVQLVKASRWLAEGDRQERYKRGLPRKQR